LKPTVQFNSVCISYPSLFTNAIWVGTNIFFSQNTWNINTPMDIMNGFLGPVENNAFMASPVC